MAGYIVYNGFWNPSDPPDPVQRLRNAASERGWNLTAVPNTRLTAVLGGDIQVVRGEQALSAADFVLFWDKDIRLARAMESRGLRLYNRADAIALCDDKAAAQLALCRAGLPMPESLVAPMTYDGMNGPEAAFLEQAEERLGYPLVVKECYGSFGGQVYLAANKEEFRRLVRAMGSRPFLAQRYIAESAGRDVRIYVVGGRPVAAMERRSYNDFRANIGNGGDALAYTPSPDEAALAVRCCRVLGLDFAGVDLLHGADGPLVCEVNSNAFMAAITACSGVDVAGRIVEYVAACERQRRKGRRNLEGEPDI